MSTPIKWGFVKQDDLELLSLGRNGGILTSGVDLSVFAGRVEINPVTKRGMVADSCRVVVPLSHCGELGRALLRLAREAGA